MRFLRFRRQISPGGRILWNSVGHQIGGLGVWRGEDGLLHGAGRSGGSGVVGTRFSPSSGERWFISIAKRSASRWNVSCRKVGKSLFPRRRLTLKAGDISLFLPIAKETISVCIRINSRCEWFSLYLPEIEVCIENINLVDYWLLTSIKFGSSKEVLSMDAHQCPAGRMYRFDFRFGRITQPVGNEGRSCRLAVRFSWDRWNAIRVGRVYRNGSHGWYSFSSLRIIPIHGLARRSWAVSESVADLGIKLFDDSFTERLYELPDLRSRIQCIETVLVRRCTSTM